MVFMDSGIGVLLYFLAAMVFEMLGIVKFFVNETDVILNITG